MLVLVTRPVREAQRWVAQLQAHGLDARALPLIEIGPAPDPGSVEAAWEQLEHFQAVMFVSGNAVDRFSEGKRPGVHIPRVWSAIKTRAWAPGPGTREALLQAGVPQACIDSPADDAEQFDSPALWQQVSGQLRAGDRVLVVRGDGNNGNGRDWLAGQLVQRGVDVQTLTAYTRNAPHWAPPQFELAQQGATDGSIWLFSSSESLAHLLALLPVQSWQHARAVATHPRIAQAARDAGFGVVCLSRPTVADVVASIESFR